MKKLHTFAFYALVTPTLALGAGSVLAQYTGNLNSVGAAISQSAATDASNYGQDNQRNQPRSQSRSYLDSVPRNGMHASNLMGATVHTSNDDDIGSVDDLILDQSGQVIAVIVGVGGFLGMGEKDVAIGWGNVTKTDTGDDMKLRADVSREALQAAPEFSARDHASTARDNARNQRDQNTQPRSETNQRDNRAQANMQHRGHIASVPANGFHASNLIGMDVHTNDNEDIGSVGDLIIDENGKVVAIVVSVGGFLGMGQKDVAISWDNVTRSGAADDMELRVALTRDDLRSAPEFANRK
ncbi:hypothetical protein A28LD_1273 [Idiomarina sp. A28L]|uniref:PRC-barrel domain-containing protein n=1 Tax=Idiomarina sp. A28L TaxID=1036674 RepID=UPI00021386F5|nr:PRC-barrel domain-containing protein [Idiomarina sp. A28L]EGN75256.1 hypothetical protein A28LD_1273 [Idiomarina sp. A28L]